MGLLDMFRGGKKTEPSPPLAVHCPHVTLVPRWDQAADMGHEDRATSFRCDACSSTFTPDETRELRRTEAERLARDL